MGQETEPSIPPEEIANLEWQRRAYDEQIRIESGRELGYPTGRQQKLTPEEVMVLDAELEDYFRRALINPVSTGSGQVDSNRRLDAHQRSALMDTETQPPGDSGSVKILTGIIDGHRVVLGRGAKRVDDLHNDETKQALSNTYLGSVDGVPISPDTVHKLMNRYENVAATRKNMALYYQRQKEGETE